MSYTNGLDDPELYFQCKLYSGSSSDVTVTFDGTNDMQPDLVWLKGRASGDHLIFDSVRGTNKRLQPNATDTEVDRSSNNDELKSFNTDGWTLGTYNSNVTGNGSSNASWNWKMGTAFSNDASATSVGSIDSSGSINTTAGQSVISWTGTGSAGTIAHGLSAIPRMIIVKNRDDTDNWYVYHVANGNTHSILLDTNGAKVGAYTDNWNNTTPTSSVFSVGGSAATSGASNEKMISYCFSEVKNYSKFSSFSGNNSSDGTFCFTGFKPSFVMIKRTDSGASTSDWFIFDNKRNTGNPNDDYLEANESSAETTSGRNVIDFLSNGFKCRQAYDDFNASGSTQIYMAFAESPFVNSNGVPNNAK